MLWHDFGPLKGPGWAANAAGGALELLKLAERTGEREYRQAGLGPVNHVFDEFLVPGGFIRGYRDIRTGTVGDNHLGGSGWSLPQVAGPRRRHGGLSCIQYPQNVARDGSLLTF